MKLRDPDLLRTRAFIGGKWLDAANSATHSVVNPATREPIGTVPDMGVAETRHAIEAAWQAFAPWAALTAKERAAILRRWRCLRHNGQRTRACACVPAPRPAADSSRADRC